MVTAKEDNKKGEGQNEEMTGATSIRKIEEGEIGRKGGMKIQQKREIDKEADFFPEEEGEEESTNETGGSTLQKQTQQQQSTPQR